jgi:hypothetical protein
MKILERQWFRDLNYEICQSNPDFRKAADAYNSLLSKALGSKQEETILNAFLQKVELLKENIHYGQPIAKKLIPAEYKTKYGITNLFRVELPNLWRMLYTLTAGSSGIEIIVLVLDIIDHKKYDKI